MGSSILTNGTWRTSSNDGRAGDIVGFFRDEFFDRGICCSVMLSLLSSPIVCLLLCLDMPWNNLKLILYQLYGIQVEHEELLCYLSDQTFYRGTD